MEGSLKIRQQLNFKRWLNPESGKMGPAGPGVQVVGVDVTNPKSNSR